jgi:DNA-binding transcriptional regulator YhcF (GntR family)
MWVSYVDFKIDRDSAISSRQQIRAAIVQQVAVGDLRVGDPLPSVREFADRLGIAPMTVTRVYTDLKSSGLIEARAGAGTFVAQSALSRLGQSGTATGVWRAIDDLVADAAGRGIGVADLVSLIASRGQAVAAPRVVMVGLFMDATRSYAKRVTAQTGIAVDAIALQDEDPDDDTLRAQLEDRDLVLTFANLHERLAALVPDQDILSLRFIPAEGTRLALAALDPMANVVAVSRFADFMPILTLGVRRFAAHVHTVTSRVMDAPDLGEVLAVADVVVMSTGAETAADAAPDHATLIEYLHVPDPGDIDRLVGSRLGLVIPHPREEVS